jgi:hypothetical protein
MNSKSSKSSSSNTNAIILKKVGGIIEEINDHTISTVIEVIQKDTEKFKRLFNQFSKVLTPNIIEKISKVSIFAKDRRSKSKKGGDGDSIVILMGLMTGFFMVITAITVLTSRNRSSGFQSCGESDYDRYCRENPNGMRMGGKSKKMRRTNKTQKKR